MHTTSRCEPKVYYPISHITYTYSHSIKKGKLTNVTQGGSAGVKEDAEAIPSPRYDTNRGAIKKSR
jgi:hypothetical protein